MTTATALPALEPALRKAYEGNIKRFYVFEFLGNFQLWIPIWVLYLVEDRGISLAQVAIMEAFSHLVVVLAEMPTGAVADRWGRKNSMLIGGVLATFSIALFGLAETYPLILVSYVTWATSVSFFSGADRALVYDSLVELGREDEFSQVYGRQRAIAVTAAGAATLIGAPLAAATSLVLPIMLGALVVGISVFVIMGFKEPRRHEEAPNLRYLQIVREALLHAARHRALRSMMALRAVLASGAILSFVFIQPFLTANGVGVSNLGYFIVMAQVLSVAGALLAHRLVRAAGERTVFYGLTALWALALLTLGVVPGLIAFAAFPVLWFCNSAFMPLEGDFVNRNSPQHLRATVASVGSMGASMGVVATQPAFGLAADAGSLQDSFLLAGVIVAGFGALALAMWTSALRGQREPVSSAIVTPTPAETL